MQQLLFKLDQTPKGRGLRCDGDGLFLGRDAFLRKNDDGNFEARSDVELRKTFSRTYGGEAWESRIRSVKLVANALNKGDMARAMMTAVLMRLPEPGTPVRIADTNRALAKAGYDPDEPRDERGRWTNGEDGGGVAPSTVHRDPRIRLADAAMSDASNDPVAEAVARAAVDASQNDARKIVLAAAEGEDDRESRFRGDNYPPLEELIPQRLLQSPAGPPLQFLDNLLDISGPGDEANLEAAELLQRNLLHAIRQIDPNYVYESIEPSGGLAGMSWQGRLNVIHGLQADLAAAIYKVRGDIRPLQEVTLDFLQRTTNAAYDEAVEVGSSTTSIYQQTRNRPSASTEGRTIPRGRTRPIGSLTFVSETSRLMFH
ncbi:MAG TPA: hypothetical protein VMD53_07825 [Rhizomicrobium sp.]|nr:hypothetical protein [Rhizomicrobium sp.]